MICNDCLNYFEKLVPDKGQQVCQGCYGKRYRNRRAKARIIERTPTVHDLMKKWNNRSRFDK